ncbi:hypothetical protein GCM10022393_26900 [Aquimarina addita]|uniref:Lipoprotein n=1 Tax=Aquimarina addita TaxID=870485 RepID=A0ABP6UN11_9FLAO
MKKVIIIIVILINFISCKKYDNDWELINSKKIIPEIFFSTLEKNNKNFKIADFDEEWNCCCNIIDVSLSTQKLLYVGKKRDLWRVVYMQGGYGINYAYNEFQIKNDSLYNLKIATTLYKIDHSKMIDYFLNDKDTELIKVDAR